MAKRGMSYGVAVSLGVIERQRSHRERQDFDNVIQMPMVGNIRSYHEGLTSRELYMRERAHRECVQREFRL
jgi:hypothetical protein